MFPDSIEFYTDQQVEAMFDEWGTYYNVLDSLGIEDETSPKALQLRPNVEFSFAEVQREMLCRQRVREEMED